MLLCTNLVLLITSYSVMNKLIRKHATRATARIKKKQSQQSPIFNLMYPISLNS